MVIVQTSPNLHLFNIWDSFSKFKLKVNLPHLDDDNKNISPFLLFPYCAFPVIILSRVNMKKNSTTYTHWQLTVKNMKKFEIFIECLIVSFFTCPQIAAEHYLSTYKDKKDK